MQTTSAPVQPLEAEEQSGPHSPPNRSQLAWLGAAVLLFLGARLVAWASTVRVEDHDSIGYLRAARAFRHLDPSAIGALSPDSIPFYPIVAALLSAVGGDLEVGARLASLLGGIVLLAAATAIAWRLGGIGAAALCALLLALNPLLTWLSIAVLAEALYIGIVYAGLWLFWTRSDRPNAATGAALGAIFALAWLTRFEGLLYLAVIPVLQVAHFVLTPARRYTLRAVARWGAAFILAFTLLSAPQVWDVSRKMGGFALNGRQSWSILMTAPEEHAQASLYGLDHDPARVNILAVHYDPELRRRLGTGLDPVAYVRMAYRNWDEIYRRGVGTIAGPLIIIFFGLGMIALLAQRRRFDAFAAVALVATGIAAPLLQTWLLLRHLAILVPILCIVGAVGLAWMARLLAEPLGGRIAPAWLARGLAMVALAAMIHPLREVLTSPPSGYPYDPAAMQRAVAAVRAAADRDGNQPPLLAARMGYVPFHTEATWTFLPWAEYARMVEYLRLNGVQYLLLEHGFVRNRPFLPSFEGEQPPPDFELLYRDASADGERIELYRLLPAPPDLAPATEVQP